MTGRINIYTDGSSLGNPGPGGYGIIMEWEGKQYVKEFSDGFRLTTNNRMELTAAVQGLQQLKRPTCVELVTDSVYVGTGLSDWLPKWKKQGWKRKERGRLVAVKNEDLWRELDRLAASHSVIFQHVAGHSGHPENERCDEMAVAAYQPLLPGSKK